ncbi:hypothetical protein ACGFYQ_39915 [Streptomyces sp. NPDC048258]
MSGEDAPELPFLLLRLPEDIVTAVSDGAELTAARVAALSVA